MPSRTHTFRNANVPKPIKKGKGRIVKIDFGEHAEEIKRILEDKRRGGSLKSRMGRMQRTVGYGNNIVGFCSQCRNLNTHMVKYKVDGAVIIERFCEQHLPT